jgi:hypothetical protein
VRTRAAALRDLRKGAERREQVRVRELRLREKRKLPRIE